MRFVSFFLTWNTRLESDDDDPCQRLVTKIGRSKMPCCSPKSAFSDHLEEVKVFRPQCSFSLSNGMSDCRLAYDPGGKAEPLTATRS